MAKGTSWNGHEPITVTATAGGLTATGDNSIEGQRSALITVEVAQIRVLFDGTTVTATTGHVMDVGDTLNLDSFEALTDFSAVRTGGTSATIRCTYGY